MKKTALLLAIILVISMPLSVCATERSTPAVPMLTFTANMAKCELTATGDSASDYLEVTLTLMQGIYCVNSWNASGYGSVQIKEYQLVTKGYAYDLITVVKINGTVAYTNSTSGTC